MQSMTGFGTARHGRVEIQVATVNGKGAQINVRSEVRDLALEEAVRARVRSAVVRGTVTVSISWQQHDQTGIDSERLATVWRELAALATRLGAPPPTLECALSLASQGRRDATIDHAEVLQALDQALAALAAARAREGATVQADLTSKAAALRALYARFTTAAAARLPRVRAALAERLREALGTQPPLSEEVLARELALHADRLDVSEELSRLAAHLDALDALLVSREPVGRALDFLLQELGREINTTGAKSNDSELTAVVLEAKAVLEQLREQVANVE